MFDVARLRRDLSEEAHGPLHRRLQAAIRAQVLDGAAPPGTAVPPERTLQAELTLSRATIRQAVKSLVAEGLLRSVPGAGTFVNARPRVTRERDLVGVVMPDSEFNLSYADLISCLTFRLREAGLRVDVGLHNDRFATLSEIAAGLLEHNVAGLLLTATPDPSIDRVIADLRARGVIVVLVARYLESMFDLDYVGVDNERIGYEATRHLLELGHTGVVHLAGTRTSTVRDRTMGYVRAMRELDLHPRICIPPLQSGYASPEVLSVLGDRDPALLWAQVGRREITAAFCFNDAIASWVQKEIRMLNLSMPRDVSVVGVDNMPYADFFDAPLTTFALPGDEIAGHAVELLVRRLNGENFAPERVLLPARFMLRRSTAPPPNRIISVTAVAAQPR